VGRFRHVVSANDLELEINLIYDVLIQLVVRLVEGHAGIVSLATRLQVLNVVEDRLVIAQDESQCFLLLEVAAES